MTNTFPDHNIDPYKKDKKWRLQFCKAAWADADLAQPKRMFYHNRGQYEINETYFNGVQSTEKYKKPMHVDEQTNGSYAVIDYTPIPKGKEHIRLAVGRLQKSEYNIVATPIDALAREDADKYFAEMTAKILLRQTMQQNAPQLAKNPLLQPQAGEPIDQEELLLQKEYGFKHDYAIAAEEGIDLIFYQNKIRESREKQIEYLVKHGVAVYKDWMLPDGSIKFRVCEPSMMITNHCRYWDFRDLLWAGEVQLISWNDFREEADGQFTEEEFKRIFEKCRLQSGDNKPFDYGDRIDDRFKVQVLDLTWFSVDESVWETGVNQYGNLYVTKTKYNKKGQEGTKTKKQKVVYGGKWIIGTDFIYNDGKLTYQKKPTYAEAELPYHIVATNFHNMRSKSLVEDLIPIIDQQQIAWLKIQNIRNQMIPFAWDIDLDAIEDVPLGKSGEQLTPKQVIQMFFQTGVLVNRRKGLSGDKASNFRSIEFIQTNFGQVLAEAWNDFRNFSQLLSEVTGFNEVTDGSTPNPKNLNSTNAAAQESTNNALYHIVRAEETLLLKLANAVLCRLKRAVKMGKVEGYIPALGTANVKYIQVAPDIDNHEYGLMLENRPSIEQKQFLQQEMSKYVMDGTLEAIDVFIVESCRNLKQAEKILAMRINRRKAEKQQQALQLQAANGQVQIQSAQAAEQAKQQTIAVQLQADLAKIDREKEWDYKIKMLDVSGKVSQTVMQTNSSEKQQARDLGIPHEETEIPSMEAEEQMEPSDNPQEEMMENNLEQ